MWTMRLKPTRTDGGSLVTFLSKYSLFHVREDSAVDKMLEDELAAVFAANKDDADRWLNCNEIFSSILYFTVVKKEMKSENESWMLLTQLHVARVLCNGITNRRIC